MKAGFVPIVQRASLQDESPAPKTGLFLDYVQLVNEHVPREPSMRVSRVNHPKLARTAGSSKHSRIPFNQISGDPCV